MDNKKNNEKNYITNSFNTSKIGNNISTSLIHLMKAADIIGKQTLDVTPLMKAADIIGKQTLDVTPLMKAADIIGKQTLDVTPLMKADLLKNTSFNLALNKSFQSYYFKDSITGFTRIIKSLQESEKKYQYEALLENMSVTGTALSSIIKSNEDVLLAKDSYDKLYKEINTIKHSIKEQDDYKKEKYTSYLKLNIKLNTDIVNSIYEFTNEKVVLPEKLEKDSLSRNIPYAFKNNDVDLDEAYAKTISGKLHQSSLNLINTMTTTNNYYAKLNDGNMLFTDSMELCGKLFTTIKDEKQFIEFITTLYRKILDEPSIGDQNLIYIYCKEKTIDSSILDIIKHIRQTFQHDGKKVNKKYFKERDEFFKKCTGKIVDLKASDWKVIKKAIIDDLTTLFNKVNECLAEDINKK